MSLRITVFPLEVIGMMFPFPLPFHSLASKMVLVTSGALASISQRMTTLVKGEEIMGCMRHLELLSGVMTMRV